MKRILSLALESQRYWALFLATAFSLIFLTITSQLEICTLGVMVNKGPSAFELFGSSPRQQELALDEVTQVWGKMDRGAKGYISREDATVYMAQNKQANFLDRMVAAIDHYLDISHNVKALACLLVLVAFLKAASMAMQRFCVRLVSIRVSKDLRERYFDHLQALPMEFYQRYNIGALSSRVVTDAFAVAESLNSFLVNFLQLPIALITTGILCIATSPKLSLLVFCGFPLIVFPVIFLARKIKRVARSLQKNQEAFADVLIDFLAGIQTVKVFAMEPYSRQKYSEQNDRMAKLQRKAARYDAGSRPIIHTIAMAFLGFAMLYGLYVLKMEVADLFFFCGLLYLFYEPIKKFAENNHTIQAGVAAAERIDEVLKLQPDQSQKNGSFELKEFSKEIQFKDVWFRYGEEWVLKGVSFSIRRGEKIAVVGPTGSGKSTIVQLLSRLYDAQKGEILFDGTPIEELTFASLREAVSVVPQKPFLFLDTIAENISFGRPFSREAVEEAARRAHAVEFISQLPEGYDSLLSEGGKNLSGGQQQRLAIARALVKGAPILVMDEATSALDNVSEQSIKEAMHELKGSLTQIVVAHRLTTIADADRIIYLHDGEVLAIGTREELLETCPPFRVLWEMKEKQE